MEYLRGQPLSEVLAERGRIDPDQLVALLVPAMRGVHAAHVAGVIHRDLKPENIILSESDGQIVPKVLDFGVSKTVGASAVPASSLTRTGALVGTPHYMALEQVDGSNDIDPRTDVYAFGVLMYRALTGHFPFDGSSLGEVILKIGTKEAVPMRMLRPDLSPALDTVVLRALSRERAKRFQDLEELARALTAFAGHRSSDSVDASLPPGAVQFRAFGSGNLHPPLGVANTHGGSGPRPIIGARPTPPLDARVRRRRTLYLSAVAAVVLMIAGFFLLRRDGGESVAADGGDASEPAKAAANALKASTLSDVAARAVPNQAAIEPAIVPPVAAASAIIEGKDEPEDELSPPLAEPPQAGAQNAAEAAGSAVVGAQSQPVLTGEKRKTERGKPAHSAKLSHPETRPENKAGKAGASALIPGERTNGFSVDEF
jgi:hypothetical protein